MCIRDSSSARRGAGAVPPRAGDGGARAGGVAARAVGEWACLLYTSDAADERSSVALGGRRIIKKKNKSEITGSTNTNTQEELCKRQVGTG